MKQLHVYFLGQVQGVGFRQTAIHAARGYQIGGWVKNLSDGRVEVLAEGEEIELQKFLQALCERMKNYIREKEITWSAPKNSFQIFEITY